MPTKKGEVRRLNGLTMYRIVFTVNGKRHEWERFARTGALAFLDATKAMAVEFPGQETRILRCEAKRY